MHRTRYPITKFALAAIMGVLALWATAQVRLSKPIPEPQPLAIVTPAKPIPAPVLRAELIDPALISGPEEVVVGPLRYSIQIQALDLDSHWEVNRLLAYYAVPDQTDNDPDIASCGPLANANLPVLAVSRKRFLAPDCS